MEQYIIDALIALLKLGPTGIIVAVFLLIWFDSKREHRAERKILTETITTVTDKYEKASVNNTAAMTLLAERLR